MSSAVILSLGEALVEMIRDLPGLPLDAPGTFAGPFASGAPAIFAGAAGRLGGNVRFAGVTGDDPFGRVCRQRLTGLGVDVDNLRTNSERSTGVAFVAYDSTGERQFHFHLADSAAALLDEAQLGSTWLGGARWLHVTGSSLGVSRAVRGACLFAAKAAKSQGASISFDPNLRFELMSREDAQELCAPFVEIADYLLPSRGEANALSGLADAAEACRVLLERGPKAVILKQGEHGSVIFDASGEHAIASVEVDEVDPTGAGDCFAAAFAVAILDGLDIDAAVRFANAAGALSTTALGPMEALPTREEVEKVLARD